MNKVVKKTIFFFLFFVFLICTPSDISSKYDPLSVPNNKYGIHIADVNDIESASMLVNSSGGDWGYITLVISEADLDKDKWQQIFDKLRREHIIPLVRLATHVEHDYWVRPNPVDFDKWVDFLNSLNWPIENRYVILFNEPNHAKEWGNSLNPYDYAEMYVELAQKLRNSSEDYFLLPAALDFSASNTNISMEASRYLRLMLQAEDNIFELIDGWNSHSYPNPEFSATPYGNGKGSIRSYIWEASFISQLGINKELPIFITETGWKHNQGKFFDRSLLSPEKISEYIKSSSNSVWSDPRIVAVTPFVYSYQDMPFDHFSWKKINTDDYYDHYYAYKDISKERGIPRQILLFDLTDDLIPDTIVGSSHYTFASRVNNLGQAILDPFEKYELVVEAKNSDFQFLTESVPYLEPGHEGKISVHVKTPDKYGVYEIESKIGRYNNFNTIEKKNVNVVAPPSLTLTMQLAWKKQFKGKKATILIYDLNNILIHKLENLNIVNKRIKVEKLIDIIPGRPYRIVALIDYYLPRQSINILEKDETFVTMKRMLPLDFDRNGALTLNDFKYLIKLQPKEVFELIF